MTNEASVAVEQISATANIVDVLMPGLGNVIDQVVQDGKVAAGTAGNVQVEPQALATFYNDLSALNETLEKQMATLASKAADAHSLNGGGLLPGAQNAWNALTSAAGATQQNASLFGNLRSLHQLVLHHMLAIKQSLDAYVENEGLAVVGFGKAANTNMAPTNSSHVGTLIGKSVGTTAAPSGNIS